MNTGISNEAPYMTTRDDGNIGGRVLPVGMKWLTLPLVLIGAFSEAVEKLTRKSHG